MRKITAGMFISLDGVVEDPQDWHFPYFNDEMGRAVDAQLGSADTMLIGRRTYEGFAAAWPDRETAGGEDAPMAKKLGDARKVVVTNNRDLDLTWRNSELIGGCLVEAAAALKNEPGTDIGMSGSVSVVRQLLTAGLIDELHLLVHPVVRYTGMRLFEDGDAPLPLKLVSATTFATGVMHLVYGPDDDAPTGTYEDAKAALPKDD